ncbi:MAG: tetratricopeptide repeat protein [Candidatus Aquicultorales bacterium]
MSDTKVAPRPLTQRDRIIFIVLTLVIFAAVFRPVLVYISLWRGDQYWMTGDFDEGLRSYRKALLIDPNNPRIRETLGYVNSKYKRYDQAVQEYKEAVRLEPKNADNHFYLGLNLFELKKYQEATGHFKESIKLDPDQRMGYLMLGKAYTLLNDRSRALEVYLDLKSRVKDARNLDLIIETLQREMGEK